MSTNVARTSQQEKLLEGTMTILKDKNNKKDLTNKLDYLCNCTKTAPIDENHVMSTTTLCEYHLQRSHDGVNQHFPSMNNEVKGTIDVLKG